MKRFFCVVAVLVVLCSFAVPVFADDASSVAASSAASSAASGAGRSDVLTGAGDAVTDANNALDGIYNNLVDQNGDLLDFIIACQAMWPAWFWLAIAANLICGIALILLKFLWTGK